MSSAPIDFAILVQDFFYQHLINQRGASHRTIESYRDTFRLFFGFIAEHNGTQPSKLNINDVEPQLVSAFLQHLETDRGNSVRTRNARLSAIHSFMRYVSFRDPAALAIAKQVLAIPTKRFEKPVLDYLTHDQIAAILTAPDQTTWTGHRDAVMLATLYNTGARVTEIASLQVQDILLDRQTAVHLHGKGRKQRAIPLWKTTAANLRAWLRRAQLGPQSAAFPNQQGNPMTRSGIRQRLDHAVAIAQQQCPSLQNRQISPHTLRHSTAMHLLQSGVDISMIALWLGHATPTTTYQYVAADLDMKEKTLQRVSDPSPRQPRYRPDDQILAFLESL